MKRIAVERVSKGSQLPGAHVSGEKEYAFAAAAGGVEVLKAVEDHYALDILARVFWKLRKLPNHPADLANHSANRLAGALRRSSPEKPSSG